MFKVIKITSEGFEIDYGIVSEDALNRILDRAKEDETVEFVEVEK